MHLIVEVVPTTFNLITSDFLISNSAYVERHTWEHRLFQMDHWGVLSVECPD